MHDCELDNLDLDYACMYAVAIGVWRLVAIDVPDAYLCKYIRIYILDLQLHSFIWAQLKKLFERAPNYFKWKSHSNQIS